MEITTTTQSAYINSEEDKKILIPVSKKKILEYFIFIYKKKLFNFQSYCELFEWKKEMVEFEMSRNEAKIHEIEEKIKLRPELQKNYQKTIEEYNKQIESQKEWIKDSGNNLK